MTIQTASIQYQQKILLFNRISGIGEICVGIQGEMPEGFKTTVDMFTKGFNIPENFNPAGYSYNALLAIHNILLKGS